MKVKTITYHKVFSLGNYENEKIGTEIEIEEGDDIQNVLQRAREFVEFNHKLNGFASELAQCERIVQNPDDFTGNQVRMARERIEHINQTIKNGTRLLLEEKDDSDLDLPL